MFQAIQWPYARNKFAWRNDQVRTLEDAYMCVNSADMQVTGITCQNSPIRVEINSYQCLDNNKQQRHGNHWIQMDQFSVMRSSTHSSSRYLPWITWDSPINRNRRSSILSANLRLPSMACLCSSCRGLPKLPSTEVSRLRGNDKGKSIAQLITRSLRWKALRQLRLRSTSPKVCKRSRSSSRVRLTPVRRRGLGAGVGQPWRRG